jgi:1-acyl-sn-glycerol-3-phosphate acyltransferase
VAGMSAAPRLYRALHRLGPLVSRWFPITLEGVEHVPAEEPVILASNHLSFVDSVVLPILLPRPVYFLGKSDYFESWRTRWFFRATGVVPVHRDGGGRGAGAIRAGVEILERGDLLGIYPEGTRSPDGRLYRGKTGPTRIALEAGVRIVPCAVVGTDLAMPTGARIPRRRPVTVRYGPPLDLSRNRERRDDPFVLRAATDELMFEIMRLSGQEYVDEYAADVKAGSRRGDEAVSPPVDESTSERPPGDHRRAS